MFSTFILSKECASSDSVNIIKQTGERPNNKRSQIQSIDNPD